MASNVSSRDRGIDAFRFVMAAAVVILHSIPANLPGRTFAEIPTWAPLIDAGCRTAVPFFFIVSGFFVRNQGIRQTIVRPLARILPIYLFWLVAYVLLIRLSGLPAAPLHWTAIYDGGPAFHLWFLPALAVALAGVPLAQQLIGTRATGVLVVLLALVGPIGFAYHTFVGVDHYPWRLTPIIRQLSAPAFVFLGMQARQWSLPRPRVAFAMVVVSYVLLLGEGMILARPMGTYVSYDVLFGTFLIGPALFLLARSLSSFAWPSWIVRLGRLSLGIYAAHLAFVWFSRQLSIHSPALSALVGIAIGLAGAIVISTLFARSAILRRVVS